jgi:hypothetical protein
LVPAKNPTEAIQTTQRVTTEQATLLAHHAFLAAIVAVLAESNLLDLDVVSSRAREALRRIPLPDRPAVAAQVERLLSALTPVGGQSPQH